MSSPRDAEAEEAPEIEKPSFCKKLNAIGLMILYTCVATYPFYGVVSDLSTRQSSDFVPCNDHVCYFSRIYSSGGINSTETGPNGGIIAKVQNGQNSTFAFGPPPCPVVQCPQGNAAPEVENFLSMGPSKSTYLLMVAGWAIFSIIHDLLVMFEVAEDYSLSVGLASWLCAILAACSGIFWCVGAASVFSAPNGPCSCYYRLPGTDALVGLSTPFLLLYIAVNKLKALFDAANCGDYLYYKSFDIPFKYLRGRSQWAEDDEFITEFLFSDVKCNVVRMEPPSGWWQRNFSGHHPSPFWLILLLSVPVSLGGWILFEISPFLFLRAIEFLMDHVRDPSGGWGGSVGLVLQLGLRATPVVAAICGLYFIPLLVHRWKVWVRELCAPAYTLVCCGVQTQRLWCCCCISVSPKAYVVFQRIVQVLPLVFLFSPMVFLQYLTELSDLVHGPPPGAREWPPVLTDKLASSITTIGSIFVPVVYWTFTSPLHDMFEEMAGVGKPFSKEGVAPGCASSCVEYCGMRFIPPAIEEAHPMMTEMVGSPVAVAGTVLPSQH